MKSYKEKIGRILAGRTGTASLLLMALAVLLPGQVLAQTGAVCNAQLSAAAEGGPLFYINEPIKIDLELGAGIVRNFDNSDGWLDIKNFSYQMDCSEGDTWPACTPAGNTVVFDPASVQTTCKGEGGVDIEFNTNVINQEVFFEVKDPNAIRNMTEQTCNVTFDIEVTAVDGDNTEKEIIELTGFGGIDEGSDGICSNGLNAGAASSVSFALSSANTAFWVYKEFSDDSTAPVDVHIKCYSGWPLTNEFTIQNDGFVRFLVKNYNPGELDCEVWETPVPGYTADYEASSGGGEAIITDDLTGCYYDDVVNGDFICEITNTLDEQKVVVNKRWVDLVDGENLIDLNASAAWNCYNVRETPDGGLTTLSGGLSFSGDSSDTIDGLYPDFAGTSWCRVQELNVDSAVEVDQSECANVPVEVGKDSSCTIYNTVFFEGIPTLSQYGMALMALLMLGIGMVGFRRFS